MLYMTNQVTIHRTKDVTTHTINQQFNHVTNCPPWVTNGRSDSPVPSCPHSTATLTTADTMCLLRDTNLLTPRSRVFVEKLTGSQPVKKFPAFCEGSLPHSQVPATCPYPEPARSSPYPHIPLPEDPSSYYPPIYVWRDTNWIFKYKLKNL